MEQVFKTSLKPNEKIFGFSLLSIILIIGLILILFEYYEKITFILLAIGGMGLVAQIIDTFDLLTYYKIGKDSLTLKYQFRELDIPYSEIKNVERIEPENIEKKFEAYQSSDFLKEEEKDENIRKTMMQKDYSDYLTSSRHSMILIALHKGAEVVINPEKIDEFEDSIKSKIK